MTLCFVGLAGCRSRFVEATIVNQGPPMHVMEFDYPSASFGANSLAPGGDFHYRIQLRGAGPLTVQYTAGDGLKSKMVQVDGPTVSERQEGRLEIILLPGGKAEFHPHLTPQQ